MPKNPWPMPAWHEELPEAEQGKSALRHHLNLAAIYATREGTATALSHALGMGDTAILQAKVRGKISGEMAVKIESLLGRDLFPRELFRPDLFIVEAE
jgi:hypothetical protein